MINYYAKRKFTRHRWRGKRFCVFDREQFMMDTMVLEITREIDQEVVQNFIKILRETIPDKIAEDLVNVQPIPKNIFKDNMDSAMSENQLRAEGYEPVEKNGRSLLWIKRVESAKEEAERLANVYSTAAEILKQPPIADVILVGLTDAQGIREMKEEGFVPLGWTDKELYHGTTKEDCQTSGSEDKTKE